MNRLKLLLATRNRDKIREIRQALAGLALEILTLDDFPDVSEVVEDGRTIEENALKKAKQTFEQTGVLAVADDTGLEVEYLNGRPGVLSSRYAGANASYEDNYRKLLVALEGVPLEKRKARFRCVMALVDGTTIEMVEGASNGFVSESPKGNQGFGYDPVFYIPEYGQTFAEMSLELKNQISHRGKALQKLRVLLATRQQS